MQAVYELATVQPPIPPREHFTAETWVYFGRGYYVGVQRALQVIQLALKRWKDRRPAERRTSAHNAALLRRSAEPARGRIPESAWIQRDRLGEEVAERRDRIPGNLEVKSPSGMTVGEGDLHKVRTISAVYLEFEDRGSGGLSHSAQYAFDFSESQSESDREKSLDCIKETTPPRAGVAGG